jgi:hypothetical protein
LKFNLAIGIGEMMSGKEFGENWKVKIAAKGSFLIKMTILPLDHHSGHKIGPIVFILGKNIAKCKDMPYERRSAEIGNSKWPPRGFFQLIFQCKMTHLPIQYHSDYRTSPIVIILSEHVAMCMTTCHMDEVWLKLEIQNGHQGAV